MQSINKNVKIKIKSQISDLMLSEAYSAVRSMTMLQDETNKTYKPNSKNIYDDYINEAVNENIEFTTQGIITADGDNITISYEESELMGLEGCETSLFFNKIKPNVITMMRSGSVISGLVFDPSDKRQVCIYETEFMPMEFSIYTRNVGNDMTYDNGGTLNLDYDIEVRGVRTERNRLTLEVINLKDGGSGECY